MVCLPIPPRRRSRRFYPLYFGISGARLAGGAVPRAVPAGVDSPGGAGTAGAGVAAGAVAGASLPMVLIRPPGTALAADVRAAVAVYARPIVVRKKTVASTAVVRDRKLAEPLAPKRLPEAPLPKAAPMSAPLPCCSRIRTIIDTAQMTGVRIKKHSAPAIECSPDSSRCKCPYWGRAARSAL